MVRFARSGTNWEGRSWIVNPAINALCDQVEDEWPEQHLTDGTVASKAHDAASPTSDHRPYPYTASGVVAAVDVGEVTEDDGAILAEALRASRDPRIRYVIHEGQIFSSYATTVRDPWEWGLYTGPNFHLHHVHVSVYRTASPGPWNLDLNGDDDMADFTDDDRAFLDWLKGQVEQGSNPAFDKSVTKARAAGVFSEFTNDTDVVTAGSLAAFFDRAGVLDPGSAEGEHTHPLPPRTGSGG